MTDEKKPAPESLAFIQEFLHELQSLQHVIEKGLPFSSLELDKIIAQVHNYADLPEAFNTMVHTAQKVIDQIKDMYAKGPNAERLIVIQQMFGAFFKIIAIGAKKIEEFSKP